METLKQLEEKHRVQVEEFRKNCPHKCVKVEDHSNFRSSGRTIVLRCVVCETAIVAWDGTSDPSYTLTKRGQVLFALGFVKENGEVKDVDN